MSRSLLSALVAASLLAACSDSTAPGANRPVTLSFKTGATSGVSARMSGPSLATATTGITVNVGSDELVITRAQIVLAELELESEDQPCEDEMIADGADTTNDDIVRQYCENEIEFGPVVVDLPVSAGLRAGADVFLPAGLYSEVKFEIEPLDDDDRYEVAVRTANPDLANASIRVEGTYNGQPFVYLTDLEAHMVLDLQPDLVLAEGGFNVTIQVDVNDWFLTSTGAIIDPNSANAGGPNEAQVEANILTSLHAFADGDRDGQDDSN